MCSVNLATLPLSSFKRQRILLYIVGRRPTHWRSVFPKCCWWFWSHGNTQQTIMVGCAHGWKNLCGGCSAWQVQREMSDATSTEVGCLVVRKAYHSNYFAICSHDLSHQQNDRQTDWTLCVYLLSVIVSRSLHLVKIIWDSRLNAFHKCVSMFILVMVSCYPWYWFWIKYIYKYFI
jgi:hypothetical protein